MQTFLPYSDFSLSAKCLDDKRLGKQRVEAYQILRTLLGESSGWKHHPAVKMWRGHEMALYSYTVCMVYEWNLRGFKDSVYGKVNVLAAKHAETIGRNSDVPLWLGDQRFHLSHQSNLIRKKPEYYRKYFPKIPDDMPYYWPI